MVGVHAGVHARQRAHIQLLSLVSSKIPVGTVPLKLLCLRSKASVSVSLSCASSGGIVPVKLMLYRSLRGRGRL